MRNSHRSLFIALLLMVCGAISLPSVLAQSDPNKESPLNTKQEAIIPIAAFTASGELDKLKLALNDGLDAGLTVSEIKEVLVQLYAYAGFPRSLNAIGTFMAVLDERKGKGIQDSIGKDAVPYPSNKSRLELGTEIQTQLVRQPVTGSLFAFAPAIDEFLKSHLFGDIFGRNNLDFKSREIATLSALANMEGVSSQMQSHFKVALNVGLAETQLKRLISVIEEKVGYYQADHATSVFAKVLAREQVIEARWIIVTHTGEKPSAKGPADWFTGNVAIAKPFKADAPSHFSGAEVIFEDGARTAWHTHNLGQLLIVTSGVGRVQRWGDAVQEIREGDVVWIPAHQKHWHGAAPNSPMTHIAIVEEHGNPSTQWLEKVSDEQYGQTAE